MGQCCACISSGLRTKGGALASLLVRLKAPPLSILELVQYLRTLQIGNTVGTGGIDEQRDTAAVFGRVQPALGGPPRLTPGASTKGSKGSLFQNHERRRDRHGARPQAALAKSFACITNIFDQYSIQPQVCQGRADSPCSAGEPTLIAGQPRRKRLIEPDQNPAKERFLLYQGAASLEGLRRSVLVSWQILRLLAPDRAEEFTTAAYEASASEQPAGGKPLVRCQLSPQQPQAGPHLTSSCFLPHYGEG
jgi:hypothetical protein